MKIIYIIIGEWFSPIITGDRPPPIDSFTLTSVTDDSALLFGGDSVNGSSKKLYAITFTTTSVVSYDNIAFTG